MEQKGEIKYKKMMNCVHTKYCVHKADLDVCRNIHSVNVNLVTFTFHSLFQALTHDDNKCIGKCQRSDLKQMYVCVVLFCIHYILYEQTNRLKIMVYIMEYMYLYNRWFKLIIISESD